MAPQSLVVEFRAIVFGGSRTLKQVAYSKLNPVQAETSIGGFGSQPHWHCTLEHQQELISRNIKWACRNHTADATTYEATQSCIFWISETHNAPGVYSSSAMVYITVH